MSEKRNEFSLDERAAEAKFIVNNPIFQESVGYLRERYVEGMMSTKVGSPESVEAHAKIKVLEELVVELGSAIVDQKMTKQRRPNYG